MLDEKLMNCFLSIMKEELIPAMGCTEPIALAYAAAKASALLGRAPERMVTYCSGNMVKNVRCVQIPNSGGLIGIEAAVALGALAGDATLGMEVLSRVTDEDRARVAAFLREGRCTVEFLDSEIPLHFVIDAYAGEDQVTVEVRYAHTNLYRVVKNGEIGRAHV